MFSKARSKFVKHILFIYCMHFSGRLENADDMLSLSQTSSFFVCVCINVCHKDNDDAAPIPGHDMDGVRGGDAAS